MKLSTLELLHDLEEYFDQRADGELSTDSPTVQLNDEARFLLRVQQELRAETGDEEE